MDHVHHEQREVGRIVHGGLLDRQKILAAPILLGVSEIDLALEAQAVIIDKWLRAPIQIAAQAHGMGMSLSLEVRFHDENYIERPSKLFGQHLGLVDGGLDGVFHAALFQGATWDVGLVNLCAILATWSSAGRRPLVREREGSVMAQLGKHM